MPSLIPHTQAAGRVWHWRRGKKEEAYQALCNTLATSDEMGGHRGVWEMCWALSALETERGNGSVATQLKERTCNEVAFIADHAGTPEMREIFLSRPDVQMAMEESQSGNK